MLSWYPEERQEQKMASTTSESGDSTPEIPSESPGSSVSTSLREEYEELLKYAVVTPIIDKSMGGRAALRRPDDPIPRETITMTKPSRPRDATLTTRDLDGTEGKGCRTRSEFLVSGQYVATHVLTLWEQC